MILDFLKETGDYSNTRVNAFLCVLCAIFHIVYGTVVEGAKIEEWVLVALFTYAGGTKVLQKREEVKGEIAKS